MHPCCSWVFGHPFHILSNAIFKEFLVLLADLPLAFSTMKSVRLRQFFQDALSLRFSSWALFSSAGQVMFTIR